MSSLDAALAFLASTYSVPAEPQDSPRVTRAKRASKALADLSAMPPKVSGDPILPVLTIPIPAMGSLDAKGFYEALRSAGKRQVEGRWILDTNLVRQDEASAMAAFLGYDPKLPHGSQLDAAKRRAMADLRPSGGESFKRGSAPTMGGYVSGMPDLQGKQIRDLLGRERMAAETLAQHEKDAADLERSKDERSLSAGLAQVEEQRLAQIRRDLAALGV